MSTATAELAGTDLIAVNALKAEVVFAPGGVDAILSKLIADVRAIKVDISTPSGRKACAALAFKVARSKTALDEMGKDLVAGLKKQTGAIDAERKTIRDKLDALKDEVRKPLTDWENSEKERVEAHEAALLEISDISTFAVPPTAEEIKGRIVALSELPKRNWQEFSSRAAGALKSSLAMLQSMLTTAEKAEAERADLERLRAEQVAREKKEREDKTAAEAAGRSRIEAEAKAKREAEAVAAKAEVERERIEQDKSDAVARVGKAERDRIAAATKAEDDRRLAAEAAERRQAQAIEDERKRVASAKAKEDAETAKREANKKHLAKINNEVLAALMKAGLSEADGKIVISAIVQGNVPHIRISY